MTETTCAKVLCSKTIAWLDSLRQLVEKYRPPASQDELDPWPRNLRENELMTRNFVVVPMAEMWVPSEDPVFPAVKARGFKEIYAMGLDINCEVYLPATMNAEALEYMIREYCRNCLFAPRDEGFIILHTTYDYWFLAGPPTLVEEMAGMSLDAAFSEFEKYVAEYGEEEPGSIFSAEIVARYRLHNQRVLAKRG